MPKGVYPRKKKGKKALGSPSLRIALALERLLELYELELRAKGLTTKGSNLVGEVLLTDPETLAKEEVKERVRKQLGLPDDFDLNSFLPRWDPELGVDLPSAAAEAEAEEKAEAASRALWGSEGYSSPWGVGPEGAEDPKGGTLEEGN